MLLNTFCVAAISACVVVGGDDSDGPLAGALAGTQFAYQGRLIDGAAPANGMYDMTFRLFNLPNVGVQLGGDYALVDVPVADGRFTVVLDFGDQFNSVARFLEVEIEGQILSPRQQVYATPLSLFSQNTRGIDVASNGAASIGTTDHDGVLTVKGGSDTVWLDSDEPDAVVLRANATANSGSTFGVIASNSSPDGHAIFASHAPSTGTAPAVFGLSWSTSNQAMAILGRLVSTSPGSYSAAVKGECFGTGNLGIGVWGDHPGSGWGLYGTSADGVAIVGKSGSSYGGWFESATGVALRAGTATHQIGSADIANDDLIVEDSDARIGIISNGAGAFGSAVILREMQSGAVIDTWGIIRETSAGGSQLWFTHGTDPNPAANVNSPVMRLGTNGNVHVYGNLSKSGGSFLIDHPLDPENKYLAHSFVESPDMMNIYNGNVTTGDDGYATITLPEWFDALNRDFRYQLTVIDEADSESFTLAKVVRPIADNRFTLRTSEPHATVSWQVTGIREDAYARLNRIEVEQWKPQDERGRLLHPEAFGRSRDLNPAAPAD